MKLQRFGVSCKIMDHQATNSITYMQQIHIDYTDWGFPIHNTRSPKPINNHCASLPLLVHRAWPLLGPGHTATNFSDFPSSSWWFGQEREIWARNDMTEKSSWDLAYCFFLSFFFLSLFATGTLLPAFSFSWAFVRFLFLRLEVEWQIAGCSHAALVDKWE